MATSDAGLFDKLKRLSPAQFDEVLFRLSIEPWIIPGPFAEQGTRAVKVLHRLRQEESGEQRLAEVLADRTLETIGKQYEGYETEAEVRKVVVEYTQQPIAGRSKEQEQIDQFLADNSSGTLLVTAPAGYGKSSLLMHWQESKQEEYFVAFHCFRTASSVLRSVPNAYRHLLRQLYVYYNQRDRQFPSDLRSQLRGLVDDAGSKLDRPLVIVLDGLDEAQETFEPFLSSPLPKGVYIIASARAGEADEPEYLSGWTENVQRLPLNRLPHEAISDWVGKIDSLASYAEDKDFIEKLDEVTVGFPLYLRYLLDDLKQAVAKGQKAQAFLTNSPSGFAEYVKQQFKQLAKEVKQEKEVKDLFVLLSVVLGAVSKDDIEALTGLDSWDLSNLPWQVNRWFSIRSDEYYSFAHPLLAVQFAALDEKKSKLARTKLIDYCADWQENHSPYALRYYAEHLQEAKQSETVYDLARNEAFAQAQQQAVLDEPELSLKTIRLALQNKAEADEAEGMAEFLLLHAKRGIEIAQESPLDALRAGNLERARKLATHTTQEGCILWHLLLTWALITESSSDPDPLNSAREMLRQLQSISLIRLSYWEANYGVYLLGQILPVLQEKNLSFISKILAADSLKVLCVALTKVPKEAKAQSDARTAVAFSIVQLIGDSDSKAWALGGIAIAQAELGEVNAAQTTLGAALSTAQLIENSRDKAWALEDIAITQAELGEVNAALSTARLIENSESKAWALGGIAIAQAELGEVNAALSTARLIENSESKAWALGGIAIAQAELGEVNAALSTARLIENSESKAWALRGIAIAQAKSGEVSAAQTTLGAAFSMAQLIEVSRSKAKALGGIAIAQAELGEVNAALSTVQLIENSESKAEALQGIAIAQLRLGEVNAALSTTQLIEGLSFKARALRGIAIAQAKSGEVNAALSTAQLIENSRYEWKASALRGIAIAQAGSGEVSAAQATLGAALSMAQLIENSRSKAEALEGIAIAQAESGEVNAALSTARLIEDSKSKAEALRGIAIAQAESGEVNAALSTVRLIEDSKSKAEALRGIAIAQAESGEVNAALSTARLIEDSKSKTWVLVGIAIAQAELGEVNAALSTARLIEHSEHSFFKAEALQGIAIAQAELGEVNAALSIAQLIENSRSKARALGGIAIAQAKLGELNAALSTARLIEDSLFKAWALRGITIAQAESGEVTTAQTMLGAALSTAQLIEDSRDKARALEDIAIAQAESGEVNTALSTAQLIEDSFSKTRALQGIAIAQAKSGEVNAALSTAQLIEYSSYKASALEGIACIQAKVNLGKQAVETTTKILTERSKHLPKVAAALFEVGDTDHFKQLLIPCADYLGAAYTMCGHLAKLYPSQAAAVAEVVSKFSINSSK